MTSSKTVPSRSQENITVSTHYGSEVLVQFNAGSHYHIAYYSAEQARKLAATLLAFAELQS